MRPCFACALFLLASTACSAAPPESSPLRSAAVIPLDSVQGRIDHFAFDAERQLLYVAALGNNTVEVLDVKANKRLATLDGLAKPQGLAVIPATGDLIVASGDDGKCRKFSPDRKLLATVTDLDDADNVRFDAAAGRIYVGYGSGALAVIDGSSFKKLADIKLDGHPESFQLESKGKRIFVNVPEAGHVAVVDREKLSVVAKWPLKGAKANFPMAVDETNRRLFVGCRQGARILVLDTESGEERSSLLCCGDTDDLFFDSASRLLLVSGGEGCVSIFRQVDANTYESLGKQDTTTGARTSFFVPSLGRLFVAVPRRTGQNAEIRTFDLPRK